MGLSRRGFLGAMLAVAAAPAVAGFSPTPIAAVVAPGRYINVLDYGADPTGTADSTAALQVAFNAARSSGRSVYLPSGTFLVSQAMR